MKDLFKNKWFWIGALIIVLLLIFFLRKRKKNGNGKAQLSPEEQRVWDKVLASGYILTSEDEKLVSEQGEAGLEQIMKQKIGLTDDELDLFVEAWNKKLSGGDLDKYL
jgi:LPXTG-motif cell wall-anchored protein